MMLFCCLCLGLLVGFRVMWFVVLTWMIYFRGDLVLAYVVVRGLV